MHHLDEVDQTLSLIPLRWHRSHGLCGMLSCSKEYKLIPVNSIRGLGHIMCRDKAIPLTAGCTLRKRQLRNLHDVEPDWSSHMFNVNRFYRCVVRRMTIEKLFTFVRRKPKPMRAGGRTVSWRGKRIFESGVKVRPATKASEAVFCGSRIRASRNPLSIVQIISKVSRRCIWKYPAESERLLESFAFLKRGTMQLSKADVVGPDRNAFVLKMDN